MKIFMLTGLYAAFLGSVMLWHGCSTEPDSSRSTQFEDASASERRQDLPADPPGTRPPTERVPVEPESGWPKPIEDLRNKVAEEACINPESVSGKAIYEQLELLKCRVEEQKEWLKNPFLYKSPDSAHSCVVQNKSHDVVVLSFGGTDAERSGKKWVANACLSATDTALKNLSAGERYRDDKSLPSEQDVETELVGNWLRDKLPFQEDPEDEEDTHNIADSLRYSLYRLNHNCAHHMDVGKFHDPIKENEVRGEVELKYIFRQYYKYDYEGDSLNPDISRYWDYIAGQQQNIKVYQYPYDKTEYASHSEADARNELKHRTGARGSDSGFESFVESRDIIPVRKITPASCINTHGGFYDRHPDHSDPSGESTFFDHTDFAISQNDIEETECSEVLDSRQKRVILKDASSNETSDVSMRQYTGCKFVRGAGAVEGATNYESLECWRSLSRGSADSSCLRGEEMKVDYCEYGSSPNAVYHPPGDLPGDATAPDPHHVDIFIDHFHHHHEHRDHVSVVSLPGHGGKHGHGDGQILGDKPDLHHDPHDHDGSKPGFVEIPAPHAHSSRYYISHNHNHRREIAGEDPIHVHDDGGNDYSKPAVGGCAPGHVHDTSGEVDQLSWPYGDQTCSTSNNLKYLPATSTDEAVHKPSGANNHQHLSAMNNSLDEEGNHDEGNSNVCHGDRGDQGACVFTLPLGDTGLENLGDFFGVDSSKLQRCQFKIGSEEARDYVQYDFCASSPTLYTDAGDGKEADGFPALPYSFEKDEYCL